MPCGVDQRVGVMAWSPLQSGLLSGKFGPGAPTQEGSRRATFDFPPGGGMVLVELEEGVTLEEVQRNTEASFTIA